MDLLLTPVVEFSNLQAECAIAQGSDSTWINRNADVRRGLACLQSQKPCHWYVVTSGLSGTVKGRRDITNQLAAAEIAVTANLEKGNTGTGCGAVAGNKQAITK